MNASSQPLGSASDLDGSLLQNSAYVGITIQNILYGVELVLYFKTMRILLCNKEGLKKIDIFWGLFSSMMVFLITVWVATSAIFGQKLWLMDFPGGPDAYWQKHISDWYLDWGTTAVILLQLMTDGLMIYRCRIIWNMYRAIVVPVILWLATLVLGVLVDWTSSSPGGNFFTGESAQLALAYYAVSVFLNTVLTCMICYRILQAWKEGQETFRAGTSIVVLWRRHTRRRVCVPIYALWHCLFGVVGCEQSDFGGARRCVFLAHVYLAADVDPPSVGGESMEQRYVQATRPDELFQFCRLIGVTNK
ncbi:hypothetical protein EV363DRAFT_108745 [Boletus edulis]|nr:hypothetical protein EV363DRAFT_108745 [Boletus edulis]